MTSGLTWVLHNNRLALVIREFHTKVEIRYSDNDELDEVPILDLSRIGIRNLPFPVGGIA